MMTLVQRLKERVEQQPDAVAAIAHEQKLRYAELWQQVMSIASFLQRHGLQRGDRIAILLDNSFEYIAAYYGILAAGAAAVPLNTAARAHDFAKHIQHSEARLLIANAAHGEFSTLRSLLPDLSIITLNSASDSRDIDWAEMIACSPTALPLIDEQQLCTIIYTSGTTGQAKGVMLSHRNLLSNVHSILSYLPIRADDRVMTVLPFFYSYGNSILHTHLAAGACLVIENNFVYPHQILNKLVQHRCSSFAGVPSMYSLLLNRTQLTDYDLSSLRYMTQAGGAMPAAMVQKVCAALPHIQFYVMYGQTEASARLCYLPPEQLQHKLGSVGVAIPGVTISIKREDGSECAVDEVGEICARGDNIMLGYWNNRAATDSVLRNGELHTGDMASRDRDGFIFIQGRRSDMIKIGAHRVHPNEIEEVIATLPDIAEVAVVGVDDAILGQVVKAVVVPRSSTANDAMAIKAHCRAHLALYKVPKFIEFTDRLPRTASGKLQRFLLTTPAGGHAQ